MNKKFKESAEFIEMRDKALSQLLSGQSLTGDGGVFAPLIRDFLESALSAEMEEHLDESERTKGNKRNGKGRKTVKSAFGQVEIATPQDRHSSFEPAIIKKRETILADSLSEKIIGLYSIGTSYRDISEHIKEMYDTDISESSISRITDKVIPQMEEWRSRGLEAVYPIVWLDAMHFKVRHEGRVQSRAVYNVLAMNVDGVKEILGFYIAQSEGASYWLSVLTDLKNRGVEDILIASTDNLKGFSEAILTVFPNTEIQKCVIHQIRSSTKRIATKYKKEFIFDLKSIYKANTKEQAVLALEELENKWNAKYPAAVKSWQTNFEEVTNFFKYTPEIRKIIYTTNTIEGMHRQVRKVTKTKGVFPSDRSLSKLLYLRLVRISAKWKNAAPGWNEIIGQLNIMFPGRLRIE